MKERDIGILNQLLISHYPIPPHYLEQEFEVSSRTIRNDIVGINDFLKTCQLPQIKTIRGKGLVLSLSAYQEEKLRKNLQIEAKEEYLTREERMLDILLGIAIGSSPIFLYQKEEVYRVSKSTIDEDMRQLRQRLQNYQIEIISYPKIGLILEGSELSIRTMLYAFLSPEMVKSEGKSSQDRILGNYFSKQLNAKLDNIFEETLSPQGDKLHQLHFNLFASIWMLRIKKGYLIQRKEVPVGQIYDVEPIKKYLDQFCKVFSLHPTIHEFDYVYRILQSFNLNKDINPVNWLQLQIATFQLIRYVEQKTGVPFSKKEGSLQQTLYNHMISMATRVENHIQLANPLKDKIKLSYGKIYQAVLSFSPILDQLFGESIFDDELAFLTIHFSTILSEINQEHSHWYRAVVICNHGVATSKLLAENLKEYFNVEVIAYLSSRELEIIDKLDVDLVFSTIEINYTNKPVMIVDSIIQEENRHQIQSFLDSHTETRRVVNKRNDYTMMLREVLSTVEVDTEVSEQLYGRLESIFSKYHLSINKREVQPMIQDILENHHILITKEKLDWKEAVSFVAQPLKKDGAIDDEYIRAMVKSVEEYGPYIVIAPHMALAHARPQDGAKKLGLSLAIFENPVAFGPEEDQQVSLVFCLSAVDSFSHLNVMKSLVSLIRETDKVEQLSQARDIQTVKNILFQT